MPDQPVPERQYGMGAMPSTPDENDYQITDTPEFLLAANTIPPAKYTVPTLPPILDQGNTPMCVAYSSSAMKARQDKIDTGTWHNLAEATFFYQIGGGPGGAVMRNALERMRNVGYPEIDGHAARHRIATYYAVEKRIFTIKQAILTHGPLLMLGPWYHNWIYGLSAPWVMPRPDYGGTGHAVLVVGWNDERQALRFQNSWGPYWADGGRAWMPYYYAVNTMWEFWKTKDIITSDDWQGRIRLPGPGAHVRLTARRTNDDNIWATSRPDGYTHRRHDGKVLWRNGYQYLWNGAWVNDFAKVMTHTKGVRYIHRDVAAIVARAA